MWRSAWLLVRLRTRRLLNLSASGFARRRKDGAATRAGVRRRRTATGRKRGGELITLLLGVLIALWSTTVAFGVVLWAKEGPRPSQVVLDARLPPEPPPPLPDGATPLPPDEATPALDDATPTPGEATPASDGATPSPGGGDAHEPAALTVPAGSHAARPDAATHAPAARAAPSARAAEAGDALPFASRLALFVGLIVVSSLLMSLGAREMAAPEWDMEWLATLPVPLPALLGMRIVERALVNPWGLLMLWPALAVIAREGGAGLWSPLVGLAAALPLLLVVGALRTLADTGLRLLLAPSRLRNLQASMAIAGLLVFYSVIALSTHGREVVLDVFAPVALLFDVAPSGLAVRALLRPPAEALVAWGAMLAQCALIVVGAYTLLSTWLRRGIVAGGGQTGTRRKRAAVAGAAGTRPAEGPLHAPAARRGWRRLLTPVQVRELRLLLRDRNFMVQTMVLPTVIIGAQALINPQMLPGIAADAGHLGAVAFGLTAYALVFSALQTLNAEGHALWILYTLPVPLEEVLRQKARLWAGLSLVYPLVVFTLGMAASGPSAEAFGVALVVCAGVPIYATIATCLGVFACDPLSPDVQRKVRPSHVYAYMALASLYAYAVYTPSWWHRVALVTLSALLASALWQKARDRLPYLLDPVEAAPVRVSIADGLVGLLLFFVLQGVLFGAFGEFVEAPGLRHLLSFAGAGVATIVFMLAVLQKSGARGLTPWMRRPGRSLGWGLAAALPPALLAFGWTWLATRTDTFGDELRQQADFGALGLPWLLVLAVLVAPPCEEFLFRGLVFSGLRRTVRLPAAALASAALFAAVHPPVAMFPVFVLGLCAAFVRERTGDLLGPIATHAAYNLLVVGTAWWVGVG